MGRAWHVVSVSFVAAASCTCQPISPVGCDTVLGEVDGLLVEGQPSALELAVMRHCFDPSGANHGDVPERASGVTVEVFDPDNRAVAIQVDGPHGTRTGSSLDARATVTFTPAKRGAYTVSALFEPNLGRVQATVVVAVMRADAGARTVPVDFPADCGDYGLLSDGRPVCARPMQAHAELWLDGQAFQGLKFVVDGASIWRVQGASTQWSVERLRGDAGSFVPVLALTAFQPPTIAVRGDHLWAASDGGALTHLSPASDGGWMRSEVILPIDFGSIFAADDGLLIAPSSALLAGSVIWLPADGGTQQVVASGRVEGARVDEDGLWFSTATLIPTGFATRLTSATVRDGIVGQVTVPLPSVAHVVTPPLFPSAAVLPRGFHGGAPAVWVHGDPSVFELFSPGDGFQEVGSATARHAFARSNDGKTLKIFDR